MQNTLDRIVCQVYICPYMIVRGNPVGFGAAQTLKLCGLSEVELAHFHGGHHHVKRLFPTGAGWDPHYLYVLQHVQEALIEAKVTDPAHYLAILDQECAVACHASQDFLVGINFADVPQPGHQDAAKLIPTRKSRSEEHTSELQSLR